MCGIVGILGRTAVAGDIVDPDLAAAGLARDVACDRENAGAHLRGIEIADEPAVAEDEMHHARPGTA